MHCLTESEISHWLQQRGIVEDPYNAPEKTDLYLQFYKPENHLATDAFLRIYGELIFENTGTVIHITDWGLYTESEMIAIMGIRSQHSEERRLIDAPGHLLESSEMETAISLMMLTASFSWSSYWYCPTGRSTLFNWEGEIFDFWTDDPAKIQILKKLLLDFELNETPSSKRVDESVC